MSSLIKDNLEEIGRLCRLYGMRKLELFGSILRRVARWPLASGVLALPVTPQEASDYL